VPTTLLMLAAITFFYQIKDSAPLKAMLTAVRPVVVGLLLWTAYDLAVSVFNVKKLGWGPAMTGGWDKLLIAGATFGLLTFTPINPALIIFGAAALGYFIYR